MSVSAVVLRWSAVFLLDGEVHVVVCDSCPIACFYSCLDIRGTSELSMSNSVGDEREVTRAYFDLEKRESPGAYRAE